MKPHLSWSGLCRCRKLFKLLPNIEVSLKKIVLSFLAFLAAFVICSDDALAQAHKQGYLPEGAKTRVGKGFVYAIAFSPDSTKLAVASSIGVCACEFK